MSSATLTDQTVKAVMSIYLVTESYASAEPDRRRLTDAARDWFERASAGGRTPVAEVARELVERDPALGATLGQGRLTLFLRQAQHVFECSGLTLPQLVHGLSNVERAVASFQARTGSEPEPT